jgi:hypothetical protein
VWRPLLFIQGQEMKLKKPHLVTGAKFVHRRHSIILLIVTFVLNSAAGLWSMLPDAFVNRLPPSMIFSISGFISILTVGIAYIRQDKLAQAVRDATGVSDDSSTQ